MVFGLQGGLVNKTFDQNGLYFSEQYTPGMGYDPTLPSGENFADNNSMYADFNAGVFIFDGNPLKVANPFVGFSIFHRSEQCRVGKECVRKCISRGSPYNKKK